MPMFAPLFDTGGKGAADMMPIAVAVLVGRVFPACQKAWPDAVTSLNSLKH